MSKKITPSSQKPITFEFSNFIQYCLNQLDRSHNWGTLSSLCMDSAQQLQQQMSTRTRPALETQEQIANLENIGRGASVLERDHLTIPLTALENKMDFRRILMAARSVGRFAKDLSQLMGQYSQKYYKNGDQNPPLSEVLTLNDRLTNIIALNMGAMQKLVVDPPTSASFIDFAMWDRKQEVLPVFIKSTFSTAFKLAELSGDDFRPRLPFKDQEWFQKLPIRRSKLTLSSQRTFNRIRLSH